ncbi:uncharacterized protein EDB93DRAFT_325841 [Suillus bovinus]|uniref:uncharacterized protein n=1 Tax=Suillus bovinus TaxID=48563 RepID=UPI001B87BBCF|nr:uncharacterized protein EDB93DRAFT_325841 [Suillus bovinus]KAG2150625.1 hypothetical protein EDB93DRAFT_325841 [Suillus bovinus]
MQSNRPSLHAGKLGLPSSPACTRLKRDGPFAEGHSRNQSQPIAFTVTRPLRLRGPSVSVPTSDIHVAQVSTRPGTRAMGTTFSSRSKPPAVSRESSTSASSKSSASSFSFRERMNSQSSSSTSLEDYFKPPTKSTGPDKPSKTVLDQHEDPKHGTYFSTLENGHNIWNRVAAAASVLTVNVNKAWYSRIGASDEEGGGTSIITFPCLPKFSIVETAPGRDSHLTRVMKVYHLAKARHPSDLPDWLFDERERKPSLSSRFTESSRGTISDTQPSRPSAPRYVYDDAASHALPTHHSQTTSHVLASSEKTGSSKAADRLKAFRDAKRADLGVRHVSSKSESLSYSPSRIHTSVGTYHNGNYRSALSSPTRRPALLAQPSQPGAF